MRIALALVFAAGCVSGENASHDLASKPAPVAVPAPVVAAPPAADGGAVAAAKLPDKAEVEMSGTLELPKGKTGEVEMWITDGPCWKKGVKSFARAGATTDRWGVEVFVPQGTQLYACARLAPKAGGKATVHGEAGPFLGKGGGEVIFSKVGVTLKNGAPVDAPAPR